MELCMTEAPLTSEEALLLMAPTGEETDKKRIGNARPSVNATTMSCRAICVKGAIYFSRLWRERPQRNFGREESDSVSLQRLQTATPRSFRIRSESNLQPPPQLATGPRYRSVLVARRRPPATSLIATLRHPLYLCDNATIRTIRKIRDASDSSPRSLTPRRRSTTAVDSPGNTHFPFLMTSKDKAATWIFRRRDIFFLTFTGAFIHKGETARAGLRPMLTHSNFRL